MLMTYISFISINTVPVVMNWGFLENWKSTAPVSTLV